MSVSHASVRKVMITIMSMSGVITLTQCQQSWHVQMVCCQKSVTVNQTTLSSIYHAIFASILKYGTEIWGQHSNRFLNRIEALQNKALKTITFSNSRDPVLTLKFYNSQII